MHQQLRQISDDICWMSLYKMEPPHSPIRKVLLVLVLIILPHVQVGDGKAPVGQCSRQALQAMPYMRLLGPTHGFLRAGAC